MLVEETPVSSTISEDIDQLIVRTYTELDSLGENSYYLIDHIISTHDVDTHHHLFFEGDCFLFTFNSPEFLPYELDSCLDECTCSLHGDRSVLAVFNGESTSILKGKIGKVKNMESFDLGVELTSIKQYDCTDIEDYNLLMEEDPIDETFQTTTYEIIFESYESEMVPAEIATSSTAEAI